MTGFMTPDECEDNCCDDSDCVLPVVDCSIAYFEEEDDVLSWEVSGADEAWIVRRCGYYYGTEDILTDVELDESGNASGSLIPLPTCVYYLYASNDCGEVNTLCYSYTCSICIEEEGPNTLFLGTMYTISGMPDSITVIMEVYRDSDSAHLATITATRTGTGLYNHSGFIAWNSEDCCWEDYTVDLAGTISETYEVIIHIGHIYPFGGQNWSFPGTYSYARTRKVRYTGDPECDPIYTLSVWDSYFDTVYSSGSFFFYQVGSGATGVLTAGARYVPGGTMPHFAFAELMGSNPVLNSTRRCEAYSYTRYGFVDGEVGIDYQSVKV
jgi:hypothetical protein